MDAKGLDLGQLRYASLQNQAKPDLDLSKIDKEINPEDYDDKVSFEELLNDIITVKLEDKEQVEEIEGLKRVEQAGEDDRTNLGTFFGNQVDF